MMIPTLKTRGQMAELAVKLTQAGAGHQVPLLRAAMAGALRFVLVAPGGRLPRQMLKDAQDPRPLAVVLADDTEEPAGLAGYPQAARLLRWSGYTIVHGAGGEAWHYQFAVEAAAVHRRVLIVETATAHEDAWDRLARRVAPRTPGLRLKVPPGRPPHPRLGMPVGERVQ